MLFVWLAGILLAYTIIGLFTSGYIYARSMRLEPQYPSLAEVDSQLGGVLWPVAWLYLLASWTVRGFRRLFAFGINPIIKLGERLATPRSKIVEPAKTRVATPSKPTDAELAAALEEVEEHLQRRSL